MDKCKNTSWTWAQLRNLKKDWVSQIEDPWIREDPNSINSLFYIFLFCLGVSQDNQQTLDSMVEDLINSTENIDFRFSEVDIHTLSNVLEFAATTTKLPELKSFIEKKLVVNGVQLVNLAGIPDSIWQKWPNLKCVAQGIVREFSDFDLEKRDRIGEVLKSRDLT